MHFTNPTYSLAQRELTMLRGLVQRTWGRFNQAKSLLRSGSDHEGLKTFSAAAGMLSEFLVSFEQLAAISGAHADRFLIHRFRERMGNVVTEMEVALEYQLIEDLCDAIDVPLRGLLCSTFGGVAEQLRASLKDASRQGTSLRGKGTRDHGFQPRRLALLSEEA